MVIAPGLLQWYDRHARDLPWRVPPGGSGADPYRVWLSEVMLQQTTVAAVRAYFLRFTELWPTVADLAAADDAQVMAEWAGLGYYARARNLLACARAVAETGFPRDRAGLLALPGIGPYTAAAIAAIAFDQPETVVDGNVERVIARLFAVETPLPRAKAELTRLAATQTPQHRPGDYAQAMMDLGATICTPRNPACGICPLTAQCQARARGIAADLPRKAPKTPKPTRTGTAWVARQGAAVLLEHRPARGLLGGVLAFPSTGWDGRDLPPPGPAEWQDIGTVRHVFSHFNLDLTVMMGDLTGQPTRGHLARDVDRDALPGLMRKVWDMAQAHHSG
ncbi:A/G-specific adenine glycosylase [Paracoccus sp. (in: a-proteobacteria)]|uniref:A/G-specific adenine glycosylase n=1 Tax=Paracoccus sp. TaxID=267 RepID=UPI0026E0168B|nr:A/G-specific adenine glycosylase [Paracoccus sp. (in: a-proteobacteria)]MDO5648328.1 A/G-specific adenine glycosylase [Paracoccus sp. (in: a-proteobacteria)]